MSRFLTDRSENSIQIYRRMADAPRMYSYKEMEEPADLPNDDFYVNKMQDILTGVPCVGVPPEPSMIEHGVYLGTSANAENLALLKQWHIQYLLNCDGGSYIRFRRLRERYGAESGVLGYEEIPAEDTDHFNIRGYFDKVQAFVTYAKSRGGRVLIYCPGVSRSGAIALAYLITAGQSLLQATRSLKEKRRVVLGNTNFMRQLVQYARDRGQLDGDVKGVRTQNFFAPINSYRVKTAHLPYVKLYWGKQAREFSADSQNSAEFFLIFSKF